MKDTDGTMLTWFQALMPKELKFFDLFSAHATTLVEGATALRPVLRGTPDAAGLEQAIRAAIARKPRGHDFDYSRGAPRGAMARGMNHTGG